MNEKIVVGAVEAEGIEVMDFGDAMVETKQPHAIQQIKDSAISFTYFGFDE